MTECKHCKTHVPKDERVVWNYVHVLCLPCARKEIWKRD